VCNQGGQLLRDVISDNGLKSGSDTGNNAVNGVTAGGSSDSLAEVCLLLECLSCLLGDRGVNFDGEFRRRLRGFFFGIVGADC
jgi:hypothetical protein